MDMRDRFITAVYQKAVEDKRIVFLTCEYGAPSLDRFRTYLAKQFVNTGISEQNTISVAAGMAKEGRRVIVYSIASFITLRCLEQIKLDLCAMALPVTIAAVGPGYAYGVDGPTHHSTEDLAVMRAMSEITIYSPSDGNSVQELSNLCFECRGPVYFRLDRGCYPELRPLAQIELDHGFRMFGNNRQACLVTTGSMVHTALKVARDLRKKAIDLTVIDIFRLKPLDADFLGEVLARHEMVLTLEEHSYNGGLGSLIAEIMADLGIWLPLKRLALKDGSLYAYGPREELQRNNGLDVRSVTEAVLQLGKDCLQAA